MIADALDALAEIFSPPFRRVMWKSLGLTTAILVLAGVGLDRLAFSFVHVGPAWLSAVLSVVLALGLVVGMIFLAPPTASLVASFYLDEVAALVERTIDPHGPPGRPLPLGPSVVMGIRFAVLSVVLNVIVLALTIFTGVGFASYFVLNAYLLGREFFELAAMRHLSPADARFLFHRHIADGLYRRRRRLRLRRRAGSEPVHAPVRDGVHDAGVQADRRDGIGGGG